MRQVGLRAKPETLAGASRDLSFGRVQNTGKVTLRASQTTTTISRRGVGVGDHVTLSAYTAAGAAALAAGIYATCTKDQIVLTHASNASVTQSLTYAFWGVPT